MANTKARPGRVKGSPGCSKADRAYAARVRAKARKRTGSATIMQQQDNALHRVRGTKRVKRIEPGPPETDESKKGQSPAAIKSRREKGEQPAHLRPYAFKPGSSGNPRGGRKGHLSLTKKLRKLLEQPAYANEPEGHTKADVIIEMAVQAAATGDAKFFNEIMNRIDGKVSDHLIIDSAKQMVEREAADVSAKVVEIAFEIVDKYIADQVEAAAFVKELSDTLLQRLGLPMLEQGEETRSA